MAKKTYAEISDELERIRSEGTRYANDRDFGLYRNALRLEAELLMKVKEKEHDMRAIGLLLAVNYLDANDPNNCSAAEKEEDEDLKQHLLEIVPYFGYPDKMTGCPFAMPVITLFELAQKYEVSNKTLKEAFFNTAKQYIDLFNTPRTAESAWRAMLDFYRQHNTE